MSDSFLNAAHSPPQHSRPNPTALPDLSVLAAALQEAVEALRAFSAANTPTGNGLEAPQESAAVPGCRKSGGETRSYWFSSSAVNLEKELLRKYRAADFQGLLEEVHTLLVGLVKLMRSVHKDVRVKGYVIASLGAQLDHAAALVLRMRHAYEGIIPIKN